MNNVLCIENLNYKTILKNINIALKNKSFNILIGPNGSGKSTIVDCILEINESNFSISKPVNEKIGVLKSDNKLNDDSVLNNLILPLINLNYSKKNSIDMAVNLTKEFDVYNLIYKEVKNLNFYEYKMILFLASIIHNPDLLIIDDDLDELPNKFKNKIINYAKKYSKTKCVLLITSNSNFMSLADNIIALNNGIIIKVGNYKDFFNDDNIFKELKIAKPFLAELSEKLILYDLIPEKYNNMKDLVSNIWK